MSHYINHGIDIIIIIIIVGPCIALMSVRFDPPGAPDYYPGDLTVSNSKIYTGVKRIVMELIKT